MAASTPIVAKVLADPDSEQLFAGKTILLVRSGGGGRKRIYKRLVELGATLWCYEMQAKPFFDDVVSRWIVGDVDNVPVAIKTMADAFKIGDGAVPAREPDAICCFDEFGVVLAAKATDTFNVPGVPSIMANGTRNKCEFRQFCKDNQLPYVRHCPVSTSRDVDECDLEFPLVFKPRLGAGSHFVRQVADKEQLRQVLNDALITLDGGIDPAFEWARDGASPRSDLFFVEEMIVGDEIDCDVIVDNNVVKYANISDNFPTLTKPFFMELGGECPSLLPEAKQKAILDLVHDMFARFSQACAPRTISGVFHVEVIVTKAGVAMPIEINCRVGGAETFALNLASWGVNLGLSAAMVALRMPLPPLPSAPLAHVASINIVPVCSGLLVEQEIPQAVLSDENFVDHSLYWTVGSQLLLPPDGFQYLGWLLCKGDDHASVMENALELFSKCVFSLHAKTLQIPAIEDEGKAVGAAGENIDAPLPSFADGSGGGRSRRGSLSDPTPEAPDRQTDDAFNRVPMGRTSRELNIVEPHRIDEDVDVTKQAFTVQLADPPAVPLFVPAKMHAFSK